MSTPAMKLHELIAMMSKTPHPEGETTGAFYSRIAKQNFKQDDDGAELMHTISVLTKDIEDGIRSIPRIKDFQIENNRRTLIRVRQSISPVSMVQQWAKTKSILSVTSILSELLMIDQILDMADVYKITDEEIAKIAAELVDLQQFIGSSSVPSHVRQIISLEIEKLKLLIGSEKIWDRNQFIKLYEALTAQLMSVADLFGDQKEGLKQRIFRMLGFVRKATGSAADVAEIADFTSAVLENLSAAGQ